MRDAVKRNEAEPILDDIFALSNAIRYAATYRAHQLTLKQREAVSSGSEAESDRYEELLVNPTILMLVRQRGNIDCGGAQYVVIRYGHFFQLVIDLPDGHVSVCLELSENPLDYVDAIKAICS